MPGNNTAFISIHQVRDGDMVPNAGPDICCAMYSAVVLTPAGQIVELADGSRSVTDTSFVAIGGADTTATVRAAVLAAIQSTFADSTIVAEYL
jgi:hypothetical protein